MAPQRDGLLTGEPQECSSVSQAGLTSCRYLLGMGVDWGKESKTSRSSHSQDQPQEIALCRSYSVMDGCVWNLTPSAGSWPLDVPPPFPHSELFPQSEHLPPYGGDLSHHRQTPIHALLLDGPQRAFIRLQRLQPLWTSRKDAEGLWICFLCLYSMFFAPLVVTSCPFYACTLLLQPFVLEEVTVLTSLLLPCPSCTSVRLTSLHAHFQLATAPWPDQPLAWLPSTPQSQASPTGVQACVVWDSQPPSRGSDSHPDWWGLL